MFSEEELEKFRAAGRIASEVRRHVENKVKAGMKILELCEQVEREIRARGGEPAFPCNVDVNEIGAHYTSPPGDSSIIPEDSVVKVDIGVHVDGYVADTAITIVLSSAFTFMKEAVEEALNQALKVLSPRVKVSEVGLTIQKTIESRGLKPIRNLTGHSVGRFLVHTGKHIPNVGSLNGARIEAGEIYAVEPFATLREGDGMVVNGPCGNIYRASKRKLPKNGDARRLMKYILEKFKTLPFTPRWLTGLSIIPNPLREFRKLVDGRYISCYPILIEKSFKPVVQAEHTVLVLKDEVEVLT
jgi:methionyl aminopeptidase